MDNNPSPLETLRQLKEMLDAGAITPQEFATLKQQLLFPGTPTPPAPPAAVPPADPISTAPTAPVSVPPPPPTYAEPAPTPEPPKTPTEPEFTAEELREQEEIPLIPPPVEDPLLPPVVAAPAGATHLQPIVLDPETQRPTEGPVDVQEHYHDGPADEPRSSPLGPILIIGGVIALLAVIGYLVLGTRNSERLTSNSITAADTTAVNIEEGPQAQQLDLPPVAAPETVRVQPTIPVATTPADTAGGTNSGAAVDAAAAEAATRSQVQRTLTALYNDMQTPPFSAEQYFAPQVEQYLQLKGTTPAAIDEDLNRSYFPDLAENKISFNPATLQISPPAEDGSVTVTFQESSRALHKSTNQYRQTKAQVRARFDNTGKLTYFRQERLLENKFTDAKPATTTTPEATPEPQN